MTQGRGATAPEWLTDDVLDAPVIEEPSLDGAVTDVVGRALVVVVDDHVQPGGVPAAAGKSVGTLVTELLEEADFEVDAVVVVPAEEVAVRNALNTAVIGGVDLAVTIGGVGVGARDVTPEATEEILDKKLPGICEALRASGLAAGASDAGLSRGLAGVSGSTVVVNLASSRAAIRDGMATLTPLAAHVIRHIAGGDDQAR
ncbi:Molybdopterin binding domain protein OS=Tsukamurella paurometabola (strain ATCC 8368 / DSM /CCUG 35730 / CIP 100753 / JCM 10117 / KCTC 9821 / NBRC 16120/ NCIMB 702349 / NCTC 13040) OX=521096 GN=Tpau_3283 PE=4 SV=1 [Tsukamurella paurometabola]|nr:molybdopterin-binding protein [Tsukamurella paurometabola]SUP37475.1 Molybdenum cofactor biosynthesis protein B [Tsukamurella paurometabola]